MSKIENVGYYIFGGDEDPDEDRKRMTEKERPTHIKLVHFIPESFWKRRLKRVKKTNVKPA